MIGAATTSPVGRTRQNHAIEHATVAVLLEQGARTPLGGNATPMGYLIYGNLRKDQVADAAREGLRRLASGQREVAVSPYCGTNLVVGALVAGLLSGLIMSKIRSGMRRAPLLALTVLASTMLGRPIGGYVQRRFTTLADVDGVDISSVKRLATFGRFSIHWVGTSGRSDGLTGLTPT